MGQPEKIAEDVWTETRPHDNSKCLGFAGMVGADNAPIPEAEGWIGDSAAGKGEGARSG